MKSKNEFFNHMAAGWDDDRRQRDESLRRVAEEADLRSGQRVLDVGAGTGVLLPFIIEKIGPEGQVIAIDYAEKMIEQLRTIHRLPDNADALVMDIHSTSFEDEHFDRIIANACYPHFDDKASALKEIRRLLKPGGLFVLSHPTGRAHVNDLHRRAHRLVKNDILPDSGSMLDFICTFGFEKAGVIDEDDFFLISAVASSIPVQS